MKKTKQVYIIHGYGASSTNHWFPWLKEKLLSEGIHADVLSMPNSSSPNMNEWIQQLSLYANDLNKNTYFVAHSLGCITVLKYLQQVNLSEQIGGFVLVSGFDKSLPSLPILDEFTNQQLDYKYVIHTAKSRAVISAKDDPIVPFLFSKELAEQIDSNFYEVDSGGHFLDSGGFYELPVVYNVLRRMMDYS